MKTCAGIVTYNPDIDRLKENIDAVFSQVEKVVLIDNASENAEKIEELVNRYKNVYIIKNEKNEGIARALNQIILWAKDDNFEWVLTLDQDSVCYDQIVERYMPYTLMENVGMIICDIKDRNYELKSKKNRRAYDVIDKCITSGCFTNVSMCIEAGLFDEKLFIDSVDYDMCYSMRKLGYKIINAHFLGLLHEVGKSERKSILGFEFAVTNHSALRKYYISRNSTYLIKKHNLNRIYEHTIIFRRIFTVIFFEKDKKDKCFAILRGIYDGWKMQ